MILKKFSADAAEYSEKWYDDYMICAYENLALDILGSKLPFCVKLGLTGGLVKDFFDIKKSASWKMEVMVFESDVEMVFYLADNEVMDAIFLDGVYQQAYNNEINLK